MKYSIFIVYHKNTMLAQQAKNCLSSFDVTLFDGTGYPCYSKVINDCIMAAKEEIVIIVNHKVRPLSFHIYKMIELIHQGYGLVMLRNFYFYGFKKDLIRKVGFLDERFVPGGCEDSDLVRRLIENNIAIYDSTEAPLLIMENSWGDQSSSYEFFYKKWKDGKLKRLLPDEKYDYDLGPYQGAKFLDLSYTVWSKSNQDYFDSINVSFNSYEK